MVVYILNTVVGKTEEDVFEERQKVIDRLDRILEDNGISEPIEVVDSYVPDDIRGRNGGTFASLVSRMVRLVDLADLVIEVTPDPFGIPADFYYKVIREVAIRSCIPVIVYDAFESTFLDAIKDIQKGAKTNA